MSTNDSIVLDGIIADRQKLSSEKTSIGEVFERFAFEQILKEYALTSNQIEDGWIDGGGDGGIDGFYVIVNGYFYDGNCGFQWPREDPHITVWILTCKHGEGFVEAPLASMYMTLNELFDCAKTNNDLQGDYSDALLDARATFLQAYSALAHLDPLIEVRFVYASRGVASNVAEAISGRMRQLEQLVKDKFSKATARGEFVGSRELLQSYRQIKDENLVLPFASFLTHDDNNYVVITTLRDYYDFVKDKDGKLRRYLFDSNVRDFLGYNSVNGDIDFTLKHPTEANFWWLNNGITILATNAHVKGRNLHLSSVQIVNGLQTTETLYRHFAGGCEASLEKNILIKVLTAQDANVRTNIIQATNNQSNVMSYSLHATDDVQRNIEDVLRRSNFFFERRDHYYKNEGVPEDRVITPLELAKGFLSIVNKNPAEAARLKNKFMRNPVSYAAVFNSEFPLDKWPIIACVWLSAGWVYNDRFAKTLGDIEHQWKPLVSYCVIAKILGRFDYTIKHLRGLEMKDISRPIVEEVWSWLAPLVGKFKATMRNKLKNPKSAYDTVIGEIVVRTGLPGSFAANKKKLARVTAMPTGGAELTEELIEKIKDMLPAQPWKPGMHRVLCSELGVRPSCVYDAIDVLIERGLVYKQQDGVVYDENGRVIMVDPVRCKFTVAELNAKLDAKAK